MQCKDSRSKVEHQAKMQRCRYSLMHTGKPWTELLGKSHGGKNSPWTFLGGSRAPNDLSRPWNFNTRWQWKLASPNLTEKISHRPKP